MNRICNMFDIKLLKKKENIILIFIVTITFLIVSYNFLANKNSDKEVMYLSPYVADCSFTNEIIEGDFLEQSFVTELDVLEGVYLQTATFARKNTSSINVGIADDEGNKIYTEIISVQNAIDNQFSYFGFSSPVALQNGEKYLLQIESVDNIGGNGICLVKSNYNSYQKGILCIDGEKQEGDCFFGLAGYKKNINSFNPLYIAGIFLLIVYLVLFLLLILSKTANEDADNKKYRLIILLKILIFFYVIVHIGKVDYTVINNVFERTQMEYMVHLDNPENRSVNNEVIEVPFTNYAKSIISNNIMIEKEELYIGEVQYSIIDSDGTIIAENTNSLSNMIRNYDEKWDEIVVDCSSLRLKQGEDYCVLIDFNLTEPINIITNYEGKIQQRLVMENAYRDIYKFVILLITCLVLAIVLYVLVFEFTDRVFLVAALLLGTIGCFLYTPCAADDEYRHFLRIYDLADNTIKAEITEQWSGSKGNIIVNSDNKADIIKVTEQANMLRMLDVRSNYDNISYEAEMNYQGSLDATISLVLQEETDNTKYVSMAATNGTSILVYFPQVIFAFIGKVLGMGAVGMFYMARLGNMIFTTTMTYLVIKKLPEYKNVFSVLYFAPNAFWIMVSCSRDAIITTFVMLMIAYILYLKVNQLKVMVPKRLLILILLAIVIAVGKLPYVLSAGLLMILTKENFGDISTIKQFVYKTGLIVLLIVVGVAGYKVVYYNNSSEESSIVENEVIEEETHITYAINNPEKVLVLFKNKLMETGEYIYRSIEGYRYQYVKHYMYLVLLVFLLSKKNLNYMQKIYIMLIAFMIWISIIVVGYTWTTIGASALWGINPRYMIPILPLMGLAISIGNDRTNKVVDVFMPAIMILFFAKGMISLVTVYW